MRAPARAPSMACGKHARTFSGQREAAERHKQLLHATLVKASSHRPVAVYSSKAPFSKAADGQRQGRVTMAQLREARARRRRLAWRSGLQRVHAQWWASAWAKGQRAPCCAEAACPT